MSSARGARDKPDLPVEDLGVAHAVVVRLLLELPPGVADERLQRELVALVRRHRAVVVEQGEEARAGGALGARACGPGGHAGKSTGTARVAADRAADRRNDSTRAREGRVVEPLPRARGVTCVVRSTTSGSAESTGRRDRGAEEIEERSLDDDVTGDAMHDALHDATGVVTPERKYPRPTEGFPHPQAPDQDPPPRPSRLGKSARSSAGASAGRGGRQ